MRAVANDIRVALPGGMERDDTDIAQAALHAVEWNTELHGRGIRVTVKDGWVTLEGMLDWQFQREAARRAVEYLMGVKGVSNLITLRARVVPGSVEKRVQSAFQRAASLDARRVHVSTIGGRVILRGTVRSWAEHADAERAAWSVAGVTEVENDLMIDVAQYVGV